MSETIVSSLPISVRDEAMYRTAITPMYCSMVATNIGAEIELWHGLHGKANPDFDATYLGRAYTEASGQPIRFRKDTDEAYGAFMRDCTAELIDSGSISLQEVAVLDCECGIVHTSKQAVETTTLEKLKLIDSNSHGLQCSECESDLKESQRPSLVISEGFIGLRGLAIASGILPSYTNKKTLELANDLDQRTQLISKAQKADYPTVEVQGEAMALNPDYWMLGTPLYTSSHADNAQIVLSAGAEQQARMFMAHAFWSQFRDPGEIKTLLHPRIHFQGEGAEAIPSMTSSAFNEMYGPIVGRILVALSSTWKTHAAKVTKQELTMAVKTAENIRAEPSANQVGIELEELIVKTNPNYARTLLKKMRQARLEDAIDHSMTGFIVGKV